MSGDAEPRLEELLASTRPLAARIAGHRVYRSLGSIEQVRIFMEHHVFAVWDFMALVKSLQTLLTCTEVPWSPQGDPVSRRLINEIVLDEESDESGEGGYLSHYELYLEAMRQCGANTGPIEDFRRRLSFGHEVPKALGACGAPATARTFVETTWDIVETQSAHRIAAAFTLGREELVPEMFLEVVGSIQARLGTRLSRFMYYLDRHIHVDKERHGPMGLRMIEKLCGSDALRWRQAREAAESALQARLAFWDGVAAALSKENLTLADQGA